MPLWLLPGGRGAIQRSLAVLRQLAGGTGAVKWLGSPNVCDLFEHFNSGLAPVGPLMSSFSRQTLLGYWLGPVFIVLSHAGCLLLLVTGLGFGALAWAVGLYLIRMLATTAIYHRLLTHRSYSTSVHLLRLGCLVGASAGQMGPSWWKAHHQIGRAHV